jgi:hypothetical protein
MATQIKTPVVSLQGIIGTLSPYSYQVKPKTNRDPIKVVFDGIDYPGRLTSGQGKGAKPRFYAYFIVDSFQHWIELTEVAHAELKKNPAAVLDLTTVVAPVSVEQNAADLAAAPVVTPQAEAPKGRKAKREAAAA